MELLSVSIEIDERTLERATALATAQRRSVGQLFQDVIQKFIGAEPKHPLWGLTRDDSDLMDRIMEEVHQNRQNRQLHVPSFDE